MPQVLSQHWHQRFCIPNKQNSKYEHLILITIIVSVIFDEQTDKQESVDQLQSWTWRWHFVCSGHHVNCQAYLSITSNFFPLSSQSLPLTLMSLTLILALLCLPLSWRVTYVTQQLKRSTAHVGRHTSEAIHFIQPLPWPLFLCTLASA